MGDVNELYLYTDDLKPPLIRYSNHSLSSSATSPKVSFMIVYVRYFV